MTSLNHLLPQKPHKNRNKKQNGFTLIELMIGVGVVGVLTAVALPEMTKALNKGKESTAQQTLMNAAKQCSLDLILDESDYDANNFMIKDKNGTEVAVSGTCAAGTTLEGTSAGDITYEIVFVGNTPGVIKEVTGS